MISVEEAQKTILDHTNIQDPLMVPIHQALNKTLAVELFAPIDLPPFPQSSMDGYAFAFESLRDSNVLKVKHMIAAGNSTHYQIQSGEAVRIFTGAPVPLGADTIVMQEKTTLIGGNITIHDTGLMLGSNRRLSGSEIKSNTLALQKGSLLGPAAIGFLASMGIETVSVYPYPTISILVTGNELMQPGQSLDFGKVYDSNSYTLAAGFRQIGVDQVSIGHLTDDLELLKNALQEALLLSDIVVLTGGVSVGDFDFVTRAAEGLGVTTIFHKIKQKPGKPMYFGTYQSENGGQKMVFGLPGNPASALTCLYMYLEPAIQKMACKSSSLRSTTCQFNGDYHKPGGITHFLKAHYDGREVTPLDAQESFRLKSFATANALIQIGEETTMVAPGDEVLIHILP